MYFRAQLRRREVVDARHLSDNIHPCNVHPRLRQIYAARGVKNAQELELGINGLLGYQQLHGIATAVSVLQQALTDGCRIMIVGDFDADGATSTALAVLALRRMGAISVDYLIPNRFEDGYALSPAIVERAAASDARLIVTVDNGITSHAGVELAHSKGIQVIVTDHHLPAETLPAADAIVNPNLPGCNFPSKSLAGVGVTF